MNRSKYSFVAYTILCLCLTPLRLYANPLNGTVVNGSATIEQVGSTLNITNTPGTVIQWQDFSIQTNETTRFIQESSSSTVLNRIVGQSPSQILGKLQSNGRVFLINPNGVLFGKDATIDVYGLATSTLNLSNEDFLSGQLNFTGNDLDTSIVNQGAISTYDGGFVYLISPEIENHGVITSPNGEVILAAGHSVQLVNSNDPDVRVTLTAPDGNVLNVGEVITQNGNTSIYAGIINQQGRVSADSAVVGENGKIFFKASSKITLSSTSTTTANGDSGGSVIIKTAEGLTDVFGNVSAVGSNESGGEVLILGDKVSVHDGSTIDASGNNGGGTILLGGSWQNNDPSVQQSTKTIIETNAIIKANAINDGDGGTIVAWSDITNHDSATFAYGTFEVKGGNKSGNGGQIETSGAYLDVAGIQIDASAINGLGGDWLLDPDNITIDAAGPTSTGLTPLPNYESTLASSTIWNGDIETQLNAGTNVTIQTGSGGGLNGDIFVNAAITKTAGGAATLTLKAHTNIITNAPISSTLGALNIDLQSDQPNDGIGSVTLNSTLTSLNGNITISTPGDITFNSGVNTINAGTGVATLTSGAWIHGDPAGGPTDIIAGSVILNGTNGIFANSGSAQFTVQTPTLSFSNSGTGNVWLHNSYAGATSVAGSNNDGNIIIQNTDNANALTVGSITASNGFISLNSDIIDITGPVNAGTNTVYLKNNVNNAAISLEGGALFDISSAELGNITAGNIEVGKDTFGNYAGAVTIASSANLDVGGKNLWVTAQNGVTVSAFNVNNTGGEFYIDNITTGNIQTGGGVITADKVQLRSIGNVNIASGGITSTALGDVYLFGADVNVGGLINAGTNQVYLAPYLSGTAISIGGSQTFDLTSTDFTNITANTITVGENLASAVYASTVDIASLSAVSIGAKTLQVKASNNYTFGTNNFTATGGDVTFKSDTGNITTGSGLVSSDILVFEGAGLMSVGTGGITATNYAGLNGGDIFISGTVTSPIFYLSVFTPATAISIGGGQPFNIAQADIDFISAGLTYVGNNPYVSNTNNVNITTASPIDFGARTVEIKSDNGMLIGNNAFKATGGSLTLTSLNSGFDITTSAGNIAADFVSMTSARDIIVNSGGINAANSLSLMATNSISQNGDLIASGGGTINVTAVTQDINMAAGITTTGGNGDIVYNAGNNITLALLDAGSANVTVNAGASVLDINANGVNNINANNFTVTSAANASLDYQITGTLNSAGVVGTSDLRLFPATTTTTTTTTSSSTTEPLTTTIATISDTTNDLSTDTAVTETSISTTTVDDTSEGTESATTAETTSSETTASDEEATSEEETTDETVVASADEKEQQLATTKLPLCK